MVATIRGWKTRRRWIIGVLPAGLVSVWICSGGLSQLIAWSDRHEGLAAWAQAALTIAALAIAIWVPVSTAKRAEQQRLEANFRATLALMLRASVAIEEAARALKSESAAKAFILSEGGGGEIYALVAALDKIPFFDLGDSNFAWIAVQVCGLARSATNVIQELNGLIASQITFSPDGIRKKLESIASEIHDHVDEFKQVPFRED